MIMMMKVQQSVLASAREQTKGKSKDLVGMNK